MSSGANKGDIAALVKLCDDARGSSWWDDKLVNYGEKPDIKGNRRNKTFTMLLNGEISDYMLEGVIMNLNTAKQQGAKRLNVRINSSGGSVFSGVSIYNELIDSGMEVTTTAIGSADSSASFVLQAGDQRQVVEGSRVLIHEPYAIVQGNAQKLRMLSDTLEQIGESIANIYAERSGRDASEFAELMKAETVFIGNNIIQAGLADNMVNLKSGTTVPKSGDSGSETQNTDETEIGTGDMTTQTNEQEAFAFSLLTTNILHKTEE